MIHFGISHYMIYIEHKHVDIDIHIWGFTFEHKHLTWFTITLDIWLHMNNLHGGLVWVNDLSNVAYVI